MIGGLRYISSVRQLASRSAFGEHSRHMPNPWIFFSLLHFSESCLSLLGRPLKIATERLTGRLRLIKLPLVIFLPTLFKKCQCPVRMASRDREIVVEGLLGRILIQELGPGSRYIFISLHEEVRLNVIVGRRTRSKIVGDLLASVNAVLRTVPERVKL